MAVKFQSTHRVSDATSSMKMQILIDAISIHAPRERCDPEFSYVLSSETAISIHAPRERCDVSARAGVDIQILFQSTHRVSDATEMIQKYYGLEKFQSTHRVSDATSTANCILVIKVISIHAPRERCDTAVFKTLNAINIFQSTHRVSDATRSKYGI